MAEMINITPTAGMPPVSTTTTGTTSGTTSSGITESPEAAQARTLEQESIKAQAGATEQAGEQIPVVEGQKAAGADAQAALLDQQAGEAQKVRENYLQRIEYAQTQADRARAQFDSFQFHNYWSTMTTGQQIQATVAGAMGGFAAGLLGTGENYALKNLRAAADRDFEMQKLQLSKKERSADWAMKGVTDLYGQMQHDMAALEIKHGLALKAVAEKAQAALVRAGIPAAQAANDATVQGLMAGAYAKDLAAKQRYEQHFDRTQTQKAEQQTTEAKARAAMVFDAQGNPIAPAPSPEAATKLRGELDVAQQAKALIDRLRNSYKSGIADSADTIRDRREAQSELKALIPGLKGLNRLTHEEVELFGTVTGGNIDAVLGSGEKTMQRLDESLKRMVSSHLSAQGIKPTPETVARVFAGPLTTGPAAETPAGGGGAGPDAAAIEDKIRRTNRYLADHPGAKDAGEARRSLAELHVKLGQAKRAATQPPAVSP